MLITDLYQTPLLMRIYLIFKKIVMKYAIFFMLLMSLIFPAYGQTTRLTVEVTGFRNDKGKCDVYLYNKKDGFPTAPEKAFRKVVADIINKKSQAVFNDLEPGIYSVAVVHDANDNGKTDTNFIGIPKEGLGSSNNPKTMGPPSFDDSKFTIGRDNKTIDIKIKYIL